MVYESDLDLTALLKILIMLAKRLDEIYHHCREKSVIWLSDSGLTGLTISSVVL